MPAVVAWRKVLRFTLPRFHRLKIEVVGISHNDHARTLWKSDGGAAGGDHRKSRALQRLGQSGDVAHGKTKHPPAWLWKRNVQSIAAGRLGKSNAHGSCRHSEPVSLRFEAERFGVERRGGTRVAHANAQIRSGVFGSLHFDRESIGVMEKALWS